MYTRWRPKEILRDEGMKKIIGNEKQNSLQYFNLHSFASPVGVWAWRARGIRRVFLLPALTEASEEKNVFRTFSN